MNNIVALRNQIDTSAAVAAPVGVRAVDLSKGSLNGALSSQWYQRPDDQRFITLKDLHDHVKARSDISWVKDYDCKTIEVRASKDDPRRLSLVTPDHGEFEPSHWTFGQICGHAAAPAGYLRTLPATIAGINLQYGLSNYRGELLKFFGGENDLRAVTSPTYGRVHDHEVVEAVMRIAEDGTWKVPGTMQWGTGVYDPHTPVTKRSTTLYASDRDVFVFLCRDEYPIEVGKTRSGEPDLLFPGFIVSNSEVGARSLRIETMYLRAVCMNRNLWGVEGHREIRINHTFRAPERFADEARPALLSFSNEAASETIVKVKAAKQLTVARDDEERKEFLGKMDFNKKQTEKILETVLQEDNKPAESIWDFVQGITAFARDIHHQDDRIEVERKAGKLMQKVSA